MSERGGGGSSVSGNTEDTSLAAVEDVDEMRRSGRENRQCDMFGSHNRSGLVEEDETPFLSWAVVVWSRRSAELCVVLRACEHEKSSTGARKDEKVQSKEGDKVEHVALHQHSSEWPQDFRC